VTGRAVTRRDLDGFDAILVAVGVRPALEWVPGRAVPDDPAVFAAGDAAGGHHWEAAVAGGTAAAHAMLGRPLPARPRPSFWSDQYGTRIQFAGDARGHDDVVIDGDPGARDFSALFLRAGIVRAGLLVGRPRALPALRDQLDQPIPMEEAA
jgi:NADPH-dependent 2,4-dienoyl-CoA reductase/sulfur reductase-like enzyme